MTSLRCLLLFVIPMASAHGAAGSLECIWVENAKIHIGRSVSRQFAYANEGHQIVPGKFSVIAFRQYDDEGAPDAQSFVKTTVEIKSMPDGLAVGQGAELKVRRSYHTIGNSAFVAKGHYLWAAAALRTVHIRRQTSGLSLSMSGSVGARGGGPLVPQTLQIDVSCPLQRMPLERLSLWQGRKGTDTASFYGPR